MTSQFIYLKYFVRNNPALYAIANGRLLEASQIEKNVL